MLHLIFFNFRVALEGLSYLFHVYRNWVFVFFLVCFSRRKNPSQLLMQIGILNPDNIASYTSRDMFSVHDVVALAKNFVQYSTITLQKQFMQPTTYFVMCSLSQPHYTLSLSFSNPRSEYVPYDINSFFHFVSEIIHFSSLGYDVIRCVCVWVLDYKETHQ